MACGDPEVVASGNPEVVACGDPEVVATLKVPELFTCAVCAACAA